MSTRAGPYAVLIVALALLAGPLPLLAQPEQGEWVTTTREAQGLQQGARHLPPLELRAQVGFDARRAASFPSAWNPVLVHLTNNTDREVYGWLRLATTNASGEPGGCRVSRAVHLAAHEQNALVHTAVYVDAHDARLEVQLSGTQGENVSTLEALLAAPRATRTVVVIGEARETFGHGEDAGPSTFGLPHDKLADGGQSSQRVPQPIVGQARAEQDASGEGTSRWQVYVPPVHLLPERWIAYGAVSDVVIADPVAVRAMSAGHLTALVDWVRAGGHLVIELPSMLVAQQAAATPQLAALLAASGKADGSVPLEQLLSEFSAPRAAEGAISICPLEARPDLSSTGHADRVTVEGSTVLVGCPFGLGRTTVIGFSLADPHLMASTGYPALLAQVFDARPGATPDALRQDNAASVDHQVDYELKSGELAQIPSHRVLLAFLAAYCVLVGPVNRLVFARRPLGAWAVMPLIVIGFIAIALTQLSIKRPDTALLREVTVVQLREHGTTGLARSYLSLYSPDRATYQVDYPTPATALHYLTTTEHRGLDREQLAYMDAAAPGALDPKTTSDQERHDALKYRLDALTLAPRSRANLEAVEPLDLHGSLSFVVEKGGGMGVRNELQVPLEGGVILQSNGAALNLPQLSPGQSQIGGGFSARGLDDLLARTGRERQVLNTVIMQLRQVQGRPAAILWTTSSVTGLRCRTARGEAPTTSAITFFVVHPERGDR